MSLFGLRTHPLETELAKQQEITDELYAHNVELRAVCRDMLIHAKASRFMAKPGGLHAKELDGLIAAAYAALKLKEGDDG